MSARTSSGGPHGGPHALTLLSRSPLAIDRDAVLGALRKRCGRVEFLSPDSDLGAFVHPDFEVDLRDGRLPVETVLVPTEKRPDAERFREAIAQTWGWPEAERVVGECASAVVLSDLLASALERARRLELIQGALLAVLDVLAVDAIHWVSSQRMVDPAAYRAGVESAPLSSGPVNVRLFNVTERSDREHVMDTLGMGVFGLPDLQCHFVGIEPGRVAGLLYTYADYLFEHGDAIEDGHTVQGLEPRQKWTCRHEAALVGPDRVVVDLDPSPVGSARR